MTRALWRAPLVVGLVVVGVGACQARTPSAPAFAPVAVLVRGEAFATAYHVKVIARSADESERILALAPELDAFFASFSRAISTYDAESELSRFNAHTSTDPFPVSPVTAELVGRALALGAATDGAFDVTVGPLVALWGFAKDAPPDRTAPPTDEEIARVRADTGPRVLTVEGGALRKTRPGVRVDVNGIAPGFAVDRVAALLDARGFVDYLVEIGGEVRARGQNDRGVPWSIGINVPRAESDPSAVFKAVSLVDQSLATSGNYRKFFAAGGKRYGHILDPRTGSPVDTRVLSASAIAPDCTTAEAFAKAGMVLGESAFALAERVPGVALLLIVEDDGGRMTTLTSSRFPPLTD